MLSVERPASDPESVPAGRPTCYRCYRPEALCYCAELVPVPNRTRVIIVQHPREQFHPINTARLVERCLENAEVVRGPLASLGPQFAHLGVAPDTALLFPSADAIDLADLREDQRPRAVVVLDGTWHQAKTLLRDLPQLAALPRVRFTPDQPSDYRIRKEPDVAFLSTLESVGHVLGRLEPQLDLTPLYELFRRVIDQNIAARRPAESDARFRFRGRGRGYRLPEALTRERQPIAVYAESARLGGARARGGLAERRRAPLIVVAEKLDTAERLCILLESGEHVRPELLDHLGVTPARYAANARSIESARAELSAFLGEASLVAFHPSSVALLEGLGLMAHRPLFLKGTYCDWTRSRGREPQQWGSLDEICAREALELDAVPGRGWLRLEQTKRLFALLRRQALDDASKDVELPS